MEGSLHTELGRVVLAKHVLDLRLVVLALVGHLLGDLIAPVRDQVERLLPDLFDQVQVKVMLGDDQAEVDQVAETLADA